MKYIIGSLMALAVCCWAIASDSAQSHVQLVDDSEGMSIQGGCSGSYWSAAYQSCGPSAYCPSVGGYVACPNVTQSVSGNQVYGIVNNYITCYVCGTVACGTQVYTISPPCTITPPPPPQ
jgi:hypothetical protein